MNKGKLYLIPTLLGDTSPREVLPAGLGDILARIIHFVVEDLRSARRFLKKIDRDANIDNMHFFLLNEHSSPEEAEEILEVLRQGHDAGLLSEAGLPCIADPGSGLVSMAHAQGIRVIPLSGPSSITLALMASGFNGQNFAFRGYLPVDTKMRAAAIRKMEQSAYREDQTQIFIETPYRNMQIFNALIVNCLPETRLCIAANLSCENEMISTRSIRKWKENPPMLNKQPAVFLIYK
jgi:16S rRNA (cytidine1402-2'-O)-methyltransferase